MTDNEPKWDYTTKEGNFAAGAAVVGGNLLVLIVYILYRTVPSVHHFIVGRQQFNRLNRKVLIIGQKNSQYLRLVDDCDQIKANKKAIPIKGRKVLINPTINIIPTPAEL